MTVTMVIPEKLKSASLGDLEDTVRILQAAHDHIESRTHVFDIGSYGSDGDRYCCYIGSVRAVNDEGMVAPGGKSLNNSSDLALRALDMVAESKGATRNQNGRPAGGIAETLGFDRGSYGYGKTGPLSVFRDAIREVCAEVESRRESE